MRNRKQWRIPMLSLTHNKDDGKAYVPKDFEDWREIPSMALERVEVREALVKALGSLEQHDRETFLLRDSAGRTARRRVLHSHISGSS